MAPTNPKALLSMAGVDLNALFVISATFFLTFMSCQAIYRLYFHPLRRFPGPRLAAMTTLHKFYFKIIRDGDWIFEIQRLHKIYGPIVRVTPDGLHFSDPTLYNTIYNNKHAVLPKDGDFYRVLQSPHGLVGSTDHEWHRKRRQVLDPFYSKQAVSRFEGNIWQKIENFCAVLDKHVASGKTISLLHPFKCLTIDIAWRYTFGNDNDSLKHPELKSTWLTVLNDSFATLWVFELFWRTHNFIMGLPQWFVQTTYPKMLGFAAITRGVMEQISIQNESLHSGNNTGSFSALFRPNEKYGYTIDPPEYISQIGFELLAAGTEEPSNAMFMTTFRILYNPDVEKKLVAELDEAFPDPNAMSLRTMEQLPYLTCVIKEGLRLSHGVPSPLTRVVPRGGLEIGSEFIPAGTKVGQSTHVVLKDPSIYPDPESFVPERWMGEEGKTLEKYSVIFSKGPRHCIGLNLARAEITMIIATMFRRYRMELKGTGMNDIEWRDYFVPRWRGSLNVTVKPREA